MDRSQHYTVNINGRIRQSGFFGRDFSYRITPTHAGPVRLAPIRVTIGGRTLTAEGVNIIVKGIEKQDAVLIDVAASHESVLVNETFEITLTVAIRRLQGEFARYDPLLTGAPPHLQIPYIGDDTPAGIRAPDVRETLQGMLVSGNREPAFRINEYRIPRTGLLGIRMRELEEDARFRLQREPVTRDGKSYFAYRLTLRYVAEEQGTYTFGPVVFKGKIATAAHQDGTVDHRDIFAVGPACTVRVVPPPEEGRPATYIGVLGSNITAEALLDTQTCRVGDPLQLTLRVSRILRVDNLLPPKLNEHGDLTRRFRVYEDTLRIERKPERIDLTYRVRPTEPGTYEVPPIEIAYFDTEERAYRTVETKPIPIRVNPATDVQAPIMIGEADDGETDAQGQDPSLIVAPFDTTSTGLFGGGRAMSRLWPWALPGPLLWLSVLLAGHTRRMLAERRSGSRRRRALQRAVRSLREARAAAAQGNADAHALICTALREYLTDRYDVSGAALTPPETYDLLLRNAVSENSAAAFRRILEVHFNAGYGEGQASLQDVATDCEAAESILREIDARRD